MADLILHGFPASTYMRTARLACEEKGVPYTIAEIDPGSDSHRAVHPFFKMPAMTHGDVRLFETFAIGRYVDEAFAGPALQPSDTAARAVMTQWATALIDYVYPSVVRGLILPRLVYPQRGTPVDEDAVKENIPTIEAHLTVVDEALGQSQFLAGNAVSLADFFFTPPLAYMPMTPEGPGILEKFGNITRWQATMSSRESFGATQPQLAA
jgi:glutathione S-transferase